MPPSEPTLKLYNTLTRTKEAFSPIDPDNVRMYVCGPTVYDYAHIGNARPAIVFDVLYRLLRHLYPGTGKALDGSRVTYVRNITDVDDKINARAARDYPDLPLNDAIRKVTETTASQFAKDVAALGCLPPTVEPRATDFVLPRADGKTDMISVIETLIEKGHAYAAGGEVLFRVASMLEYGQLSGRNLEDNIAGARVAVESHKENPADFVLWKASSENEPGWDSPWGRGRPGWHIECSAMSAAYLGETFDIHGGGLDLIFPHHENEIAQSRCAHGTKTMANYWMHNGYLQVEGRKMSKSEGNFVTIRDLLETETFGGRKWPGEVLRLAMLMTHYREPIDFSRDRLVYSERLLRKWEDYAGEDRAKLVTTPPVEMVSALSDDLNFSLVGSFLDRLAKAEATEANRSAMASALEIVGILRVPETAIDWFNSFAGNWNYQLEYYHRSSFSDQHEREAFLSVWAQVDVNAEIDARLAALAARDFATADKIRAELAQQGIQVMDYKDPETGEKRTKWEVKR